MPSKMFINFPHKSSDIQSVLVFMPQIHNRIFHVEQISICFNYIFDENVYFFLLLIANPTEIN